MSFTPMLFTPMLFTPIFSHLCCSYLYCSGEKVYAAVTRNFSCCTAQTLSMLANQSREIYRIQVEDLPRSAGSCPPARRRARRGSSLPYFGLFLVTSNGGGHIFFLSLRTTNREGKFFRVRCWHTSQICDRDAVHAQTVDAPQRLGEGGQTALGVS